MTSADLGLLKLQAHSGGDAMFGNLDEQIEETVGGRPTTAQKVMRFAGIVVVSVVVFGGLCMIILALE